MDPSTERWITAAKLLRPQGRRGEILADPHVDLTVLSFGRSLWLSADESAPASVDPASSLEIEDVWTPTGRNAGRAVLKLRGIDSISEAERLNGQFLLIPVADLPALDEGTFRVADLIGCSLYNGDHLAGTVAEIQFPVGSDGRTRLHDAPDLLAIRPADPPADNDPDLVLVPFVRAWLQGIDLPARRITMHLPPGIFNGTEAEAPPQNDPPA